MNFFLSSQVFNFNIFFSPSSSEFSKISGLSHSISHSLFRRIGRVDKKSSKNIQISQLRILYIYYKFDGLCIMVWSLEIHLLSFLTYFFLFPLIFFFKLYIWFFIIYFSEFWIFLPFFLLRLAESSRLVLVISRARCFVSFSLVSNLILHFASMNFFDCRLTFRMSLLGSYKIEKFLRRIEKCLFCFSYRSAAIKLTSRVLGSSLKTPSIVLVTVLLCTFWTPRITMH